MRMADSALAPPSDHRCRGVVGEGGRVEAKVGRDKKPQPCPRRRKGSALAHGRAKRGVYHVPTKSKPCILAIDPRRYKCKGCGGGFSKPIGVTSQASPPATVDLDA